MARASLRQLDKADTGYIEYKHFCKFLHEFNVTLMEEEIQKALKKYQCEGNLARICSPVEPREDSMIIMSLHR